MGSRAVSPLALDGGEWLFACTICKHNTAENIIMSSEEVISSQERWMRQLPGICLGSDSPTMLVLMFNNLNVYYLTEKTQGINVLKKGFGHFLQLSHNHRLQIIHILCCCYFVSQSTFSVIFRSVPRIRCLL